MRRNSPTWSDGKEGDKANGRKVRSATCSSVFGHGTKSTIMVRHCSCASPYANSVRFPSLRACGAALTEELDLPAAAARAPRPCGQPLTGCASFAPWQGYNRWFRRRTAKSARSGAPRRWTNVQGRVVRVAVIEIVSEHMHGNEVARCRTCTILSRKITVLDHTRAQQSLESTPIGSAATHGLSTRYGRSWRRSRSACDEFCTL